MKNENIVLLVILFVMLALSFAFANFSVMDDRTREYKNMGNQLIGSPVL